MERLTARNENGETYYPHYYAADGCGGFRMGCDECPYNDNICERLAAYEDTDLTPDQIRQMDQLYREKCEELAKVEAAIAEAAKKQQEDEIFYLTATTRAGRMRWSLSREQSRR